MDSPTPLGGRSHRLTIRKAAAALVAVCSIAAATAAWPLALGDRAPDCAARFLDTGADLKLTDYRGRVVYLDFWASWCTPCRESFPFMNELDRDFRDRGLAIVAVSVDKTVDEARGFLARHPAQFALALDSTGACPAAYQLAGMPSSFLIDRSGSIRAVRAGFHSSDRTEIRREIGEALRER